MSNGYKKYRKSLKKEKHIIIFMQITIMLIFFLSWELASQYKLINSFIFSCPSKIFNTIIIYFTKYNLLKHIYVTLQEIFMAFLLGMSLGFIIAMIMYINERLAKIIDPFLTVINSLPKIALGPLIIIWCGANVKSIIAMALLINLIISIINIYNGFKNTDKTKIKLLKSFRASKYQIIKSLVIPSNYSNIIAAFKINISMTLIGVIMGEFLVSKQGIGYLIVYGTQVFNLDLVMSGIFIMLIISFGLYKTVTYIEKKLVNQLK